MIDTLDTFELRVLVKSLSRSADALLGKMDRLGVTAELLAEYEKLDTLIIKTRMMLVDKLRDVRRLAIAPEGLPDHVDDQQA